MDYEFPKLMLKQAGARLKRIIVHNLGPQDHARVAQACIESGTLEEALEKVRLHTEFQVDVDDAADYIRKAMAGHIPLSRAEVAALSET